VTALVGATAFDDGAAAFVARLDSVAEATGCDDEGEGFTCFDFAEGDFAGGVLVLAAATDLAATDLAATDLTATGLTEVDVAEAPRSDDADDCAFFMTVFVVGALLAGSFADFELALVDCFAMVYTLNFAIAARRWREVRSALRDLAQTPGGVGHRSTSHWGTCGITSVQVRTASAVRTNFAQVG
jgi:hypothetical protein